MESVKKVVGIAFIKDNRILVVQSLRSSKTNSYTFVGGGVEEGETLMQAALREVGEEIGNNFTILESELTQVLSFREKAASDPNLTIEMNVFLTSKEIDIPLIPNKEILKFYWYAIGDDINISSSIKDHFIPYALENNILNCKK